MSAMATVRTRCPECHKKYEVPASSAGHRARCTNCHAVFRVPLPQKPVGPTEDDILAWLSEGETESDVVARPRTIVPNLLRPDANKPAERHDDSGAPVSLPVSKPAPANRLDRPEGAGIFRQEK
jgi:hypothetical protein